MYYKVSIFIVAGIFAVLAMGCGAQQQGGQKEQNAQTEQASQKTTQKPTGGTTVMQKNKGTGAEGKTGQKTADKRGKKPLHRTKARGRVGKAHPVWGVVGAINVQKSKIYFRPKDKKAIPLKYHPGQVQITMGGKKAQVRDLKRGQRAKVTYVSLKVKKKDAKRDHRYVVHSIRAFAGGGKKSPANKQQNNKSKG